MNRPKGPIVCLILYIFYIWSTSVFTHQLPYRLLYFEIPAIALVSYVMYNASLLSNSKYLINLIIVCFILLSLYYIINIQESLIIDHLKQNNASFSILLFLPFIACIGNEKFKTIAFVLVFLMILISLKRGSFVAFFVAVLAYNISHSLISGGKRGVIYVVIAGMIFFCGAQYYIENIDNRFVSTIVERFNNISEDKGSGRLDIYEEVWDEIQNSSILNLILGHGWTQVETTTRGGVSAHNDFLEVLYDFGIVGFLIYILLLVRLIKYAIMLNRNKIATAPALWAAIAIIIVMSCISHIVIYPKYFLLTSMSLGYILGTSQVLLITKLRRNETDNARFWNPARGYQDGSAG